MGRLKKIENADGNAKTVVSYPSFVSTTACNTFHFVRDSTISHKKDYTTLVNATDKYCVKTGVDCLNQNEPLFAVTLIEIAPNCEYALVVSLSHVLGDGHTFYQLYGMLGVDAEVTTLTAKREHLFGVTASEVTGGKMMQWFQSPWVLWGVLRHLRCCKLPQPSVFKVDDAAIVAEKLNFNERRKFRVGVLQIQAGHISNDVAPFISKNDILTSWFFRLCGSSFGLMAVNFRGRHALFHEQLAGNYEILTMYNESDFALPEHIRMSLANFRSLSDTVPSTLQTALLNISLISNWASLYRHISLSDSCCHRVHLPLQNPTGVGFRDLCIIFALDETSTGVLCLTRNVNVSDLVARGHQSCKILCKV